MSLLPNRYNLTNLAKAVRDTSMLRGELSRLAIKGNVAFHRWLYGDRGDCTKVMDRDWDNLIILDACRTDLFREENDIDGDFQTVTSCGSHTVEFLTENFEGEQFHDTVYVSANPNTNVLSPQTFHATIPLYTDENWDPEIMTVPPETVVQAAIEANEQYPNKRLIVHFIQPHTPFIGETGRQLPQTHEPPGETPDADREIRWIWGNLQYNIREIDIDDVWEAYRENVAIALDGAGELLEALPGKSVVTSDHGNLVAERVTPIPVTGYGHPAGLYHDKLVTVPWLEVASGTRREVQSDPPQAETRVDDGEIEKQLQALGYH